MGPERCIDTRNNHVIAMADPRIVISDDKEFSYVIRVPRKYSWAIKDGPNSPLCDVTLVLDDGRVMVHADVFAHLSAFFKAMFSAEWIETKTHIVHFPAMSFKHLRSLVDMIYARELLLTHYNIEPIFQIVHHLQMDQLLKYCSDVLIDCLNAGNVVSLYALANRYSLSDLLEACVVFVLENCRELFDSDEFLLEIPLDFVKLVMTRDDLFVHNELDVLLMVLSWLNLNTDCVGDVKVALFDTVRFPHLNTNCKRVLKSLTPLLVGSSVYSTFCKSRSWLQDMPLHQLRPRNFQPMHLHYAVKVNYVNFGRPNRAYAIMLYCNLLNKLIPLHEHEHGVPNSYNATYGPHENGEGFTVVGRHAYLQERVIVKGTKREHIRLTRTNLQPNKFGLLQTHNIFFRIADQSLFQIGKLTANPDGILRRLHVIGPANSLGADDLREIRSSLNFDRIIYGLENIGIIEFDLKTKQLRMSQPLIHENGANREASSVARTWLFVLLADRMCKWIDTQKWSFILSSALDGLNEIIKIDQESGHLSRFSFKPDLISRRNLPRGIHDMLLIGQTLYTYEFLDTFRENTNRVRRRFRTMNVCNEEFTGIMVLDTANEDPTAKLVVSICEMDFSKLELAELRGRPHILIYPKGYQLGTICFFGVFEIVHEIAPNGDTMRVRKVRLDKLDMAEFRKLSEDSCVNIEASRVPVDLHPCSYSTFIHDQLHRLSDYQLGELEGLRKYAN